MTQNMIGDDEFLKINGFDDAIIGVEESVEQKLIYDIDKIAEILITRDQMTEDDAYKYISFNITSAYVGEKTPILVKTGKFEDFI